MREPIVLGGGMCLNHIGKESSEEKYVFSYFIPTEQTALGGGFAHRVRDFDSFDDVFLEALRVAGIRYSWGSIVDVKGDLVLSFGKPER